MRMFLLVAALLAMAALIAPTLDAQPKGGRVNTKAKADKDHGVVTPDDIKWVDGSAALQKGAKMFILEGDPSKDGPFVIRVKLPDGFRVMPHTHPKDERVTVLRGTLYLGMGATFDAKAAKAMPAGSYARTGAGMKHFAWVQGETILQIHGTGPWAIDYVNPEDDPRMKQQCPSLQASRRRHALPSGGVACRPGQLLGQAPAVAGASVPVGVRGVFLRPRGAGGALRREIARVPATAPGVRGAVSQAHPRPTAAALMDRDSGGFNQNAERVGPCPESEGGCQTSLS